MPCEISRGSCSLCPYCATESCPHYHDHDNDLRYWVYITDRRNSYLISIFKSDSLKEVKEFLLSDKIQNKTNWAKKYTLSTILGKKVRNRYPNAKDISFPLIKYFWLPMVTSIKLLLNSLKKSYLNIYKKLSYKHTI